MSLTRRTIQVCCVGMLCMMSQQASAALVEYTSGHADIGLAYEDDGGGPVLELHYHFGAPGDLTPSQTEEEFAPSEAYVRVPDPTAGTVYAISSPGFSAEELVDELSNSDFIGNATFQLTNWSGPVGSRFFLSGGAATIWDTDDGLDANDVLTMGIGTHDHFVFGFTEPGVYDLGITASATLAAGGTEMDFGTFKFVVGSATAVPEPGSFAALAALGAASTLARRRRR